MVLKMHLALVLVLVLGVSTCAAAGRQKNSQKDAKAQPPRPTVEEGSDQQAAESRLAEIRKRVERQFRVRGRGDYYVVVVMTTSYHTNVKRTVPEVLVDRNGKVIDRGIRTEFRSDGKYYPVQTAEFRAIKGRESAIQFIVEQLAKPIVKGGARTRFRKKATAPPPVRNWKVFGRFVNSKSAESAKAASQRAFAAEPRWEVDQQGKPRR